MPMIMRDLPQTKKPKPPNLGSIPSIGRALPRGYLLARRRFDVRPKNRPQPPSESLYRGRLMPGPLRHNERDAPPMCGRPAGVSRPVRQDHVTLALAGLRIGLVAMVADQSLRVGLRQPFGLLATLDPLAAVAQPRQHGRPLVDRVHCIVRQHAQPFWPYLDGGGGPAHCGLGIGRSGWSCRYDGSGARG